VTNTDNEGQKTHPDSRIW